MNKRKSVRWRAGAVVAIDLGDGRYGFGVVLEKPLIGYLDFISESPNPPLAKILSCSFAFKLWTMTHAVTKATWPVIGRTDIAEPDRVHPWFFKQDPFTQRLSKTRDGAEELPVTEEEAATMERAAVWDPVHIVDRLRDHFAEAPNKWVELLKLRPHFKS